MQRPALLLKNTTLTWVMRIYNSSDALVDADSTPTVAVRKNGSSTGDSVAVTKRSGTTGIYDCSYNPASEVEGDQFTIEETATVASTTTSWNWSFVVLDSDVTGKVLGGGSGTISGVGARVVDGDGDAVAKASAVAALGSGTGARSVTITVNDGSTALQGATVRVTKGAESYVQTTNAGGVATFSLDDGTWTVTIAQPGYSIAAQSLVVNDTESVTYSMTAVSVSTPSAPNLSVGTLLCLDTDGSAETGVKVHFRLISGPGTAGYSLDASQWTETSDISGEIEAEFIIGATYGAKRGDIGREVTFTVAAGASFSLPEHLGAP